MVPIWSHFPNEGPHWARARAVRREQVFREALELGEPDRQELLTLLIDSLDPQAEADVEQAWMQEISRRVTELKPVPFRHSREKL